MKSDRFFISAAALLVVGMTHASGVRAATALAGHHQDAAPVVAVSVDRSDGLLVGEPDRSGDALPAVEDRLRANKSLKVAGGNVIWSGDFNQETSTVSPADNKSVEIEWPISESDAPPADVTSNTRKTPGGYLGEETTGDRGGNDEK